MVKKIILAALFAISTIAAPAQSVDEVTLVVTGDGTTKDVAIQMALRSAIEQAFGVFVSANTQILNDELVKDEIATISSGNIKKYTELVSTTLSNGNTFVSLQATVSINKLVKYAQSKGSECEFAGATFGANMKLMDLRYENAKKALINLNEYITKVGSSIFDYELIVGEPKRSYGNTVAIPMKIKYVPNDNTKNVFNIIIETLKATAFSLDERTASNKRFYYLGGWPGMPPEHPYTKYDLFDQGDFNKHYGTSKYGFPYPIQEFEIGRGFKDGNNLLSIFEQYVINGFVIKDNNGNVYEIKHLEGRSNTYRPNFSGLILYDNIVAYGKEFGGKKGGEIEFGINIPEDVVSSISKIIVEPK